MCGARYTKAEGGIGLARKTVSNLLGIPIDYTVYVDFAGSIGAIDALGGVTVDVDKELCNANFPPWTTAIPWRISCLARSRWTARRR